MNRQEPGLAVSHGSTRHNLLLRGAVGLVALGVLGVLAPACLDRPVAPQQPSTSKLSTKLYKNQKVDKIDLLFAVDNSASMADKQLILADAVPDLVDRLTNPVCVDRVTRAFVASVNPGESCPDPATQEREFEPLGDIHIGVITSSIGGHGADSCSNVPTANYNPRQEDMSHLVTRGKNAGDTSFHDVATYENKGFLNWDPQAKDVPPGDTNVGTLVQKFTEIVRGTGEDGCGFEASLESWYRFLVDPTPYARMIPVPCYEGDTGNQCRGPDGLDTLVLQQRADMIRQDSLLAVIMLSDENDCSVMDWGQNFLVLQALDGTGSFHLARGTDACLADPWASDCKSCWEVDPAAYPECQAGWANAEKDDTLNLRCFEQKRRFGINFLQPIKRYVDGLTERRIDGNTLNPVFCSKYATKPDPNDPNSSIIDRENCEGAAVLRDPSLVFLAGIVGVPWQDIARDVNDLSKGYRTAEELTKPISSLDNPPAGVDGSLTLWEVILGKTNADHEVIPTEPPADPLMIESVDPRSGSNPITGDALTPTASGPLANSVNGSEWDIAARNDLQYACVFRLPEPLDCSDPVHAFGCDCQAAPQNPLCFNETSNSYGTTQFRAKAYPGRRQLAVLKGVGDQSIIASICPKNVDPGQKNAADWGYRPAIAAIVDRLKGALQGTCWDQELDPDPQGLVPCIVLEATKSDDVDGAGAVVCPPCTGVRKDATETAFAALQADANFIENNLNCVCEINQVTDAAQLASCIHDDVVSGGVEGWCYVDPLKNDQANQNILASCPSNQKRLIRFVGSNIPAAGSLTFLQCKGGAGAASTTAP